MREKKKKLDAGTTDNPKYDSRKFVPFAFIRGVFVVGHCGSNGPQHWCLLETGIGVRWTRAFRTGIADRGGIASFLFPRFLRS